MAEVQSDSFGTDGAGRPDRSSDGGADCGPEMQQDQAGRRVPLPHEFFSDEERCKALLDVLTSIIWVTDAQGRFTAPQPRWSSYTGQSWHEQQGFGWLKAVHPDDREPLSQRLEQAQQRGDYYFAEGRIWHAASGTYRFHQARGVAILDAQGQVREWLGTCKDVHDQHRAEEALREADRMKDEFIAVVSHELRNPLAPISNAVRILKARASHDMQLGWATGVIDRQVAHMSSLLNDLLDVQRIRENKIVLHKSRVTLDAILEAAIELSRPALEERGQHLELGILVEPVWMEADPQRLTQAISNILSNAAKYTQKGGRVTLTVRLEQAFVLISVKDNGIGISPDMLPRVFELFSQAKEAGERAEGGLGIGLALVKRMVELHDGSVTAHSEGPGCGSEFVIRLPALPSRERQHATALGAGTGGRRLRILVADDNVDSAETLSVLLEVSGHESRAVTGGDEALKLALSWRPEAALLDLGMPSVDGFAVARRLKQELPGIVLIATTGRAQAEDKARASAAGFDHYLIKPIDQVVLRKVLEDAVKAFHPPA